MMRKYQVEKYSDGSWKIYNENGFYYGRVDSNEPFGYRKVYDECRKLNERLELFNTS